MVRRRYCFYGRVQGVGFRFTAGHAAAQLGLTGWVRNEYDGSVTLEVQGEEALIRMLLERIHRDSYIEVDRMEMTELIPDPEERSFGKRW